MDGEIISVGTELLMGQILNSDAQYIAQKFSEMGINLYHQVVVGDNMGRLCECIRQAMSRSDIVVLSGGLGPTQDDMTKWAVAEVLGVDMVEDSQSREHLISLYQKRFNQAVPDITENNFRQVQFPQGATIFPNHNGTAPGCACEKDGKIIVVLPGPPRELQAMMETSIIPFISSKLDSKIASRYIRVFGMGESRLETELRDLIDAQSNPTIAPYAGFIDVTLRVSAHVGLSEDPYLLIDPVVEQVCERLGGLVYSTDNESMAEVVSKLLTQSSQTLSIAESLTGGMICNELVTVPGSSVYLKEGIVVYSNEAKERLGVSKQTLETYSAVSEETALALVRNIKKRAGTDWALATTGVAGPGPDVDGNREGLYFIALSGPDGEQVYQHTGGEGRSRIRWHATLTALDTLRKALLKNKRS